MRGDVQAGLFLVELAALEGRESLGDIPVHSPGSL
jgi:hypothetical protein